jgi:hypothetical protein
VTATADTDHAVSGYGAARGKTLPVPDLGEFLGTGGRLGVTRRRRSGEPNATSVTGEVAVVRGCDDGAEISGTITKGEETGIAM